MTVATRQPTAYFAWESFRQAVARLLGDNKSIQVGPRFYPHQMDMQRFGSRSFFIHARGIPNEPAACSNGLQGVASLTVRETDGGFSVTVNFASGVFLNRIEDLEQLACEACHS